MAVYYVNNEGDTANLAAEIGRKLKSGDVIAYRGEMGAGKTTFTRGLVKALNIDAHVSSPTFSLVNEYIGSDISFYHFDMYRITDFDSLFSTGFFDYLDAESGIIAVEWSENIKDELPSDVITISFEKDSSNHEKRKITVEGGPF